MENLEESSKKDAEKTSENVTEIRSYEWLKLVEYRIYTGPTSVKYWM